MIEISIVIPAYNAKKTLQRLLDSLELLEYNRDEFEVIVVDDGSTDSTPDILAAFMERTSLQFHSVRRERVESYGPGPARAAGEAVAKGRIIACTDADCVVYPDWLAVIHAELHAGAHTVIGGTIECDELLLFPWRMAPAGHSFVTANLAYAKEDAVDEREIDSFQGFCGNDIHLVMKMRERGVKSRHVPTMRILHPANTLTALAVLRRLRYRENEVQLHKRYGKEILHVFHPFFKPMLLRRISLATTAVVTFFVVTAGLLVYDARTAVLIVVLTMLLGAHSFLTVLYKYCILNSGETKNTIVPLHYRVKTLLILPVYFLLFVWYRIVGSIRFKHFLL